MFIHRFFTKEHFARVERLRSLAASLGIELGQLAIAWVLRRPEVTSAIVGASRPDQVDGNVTGVGVDLDAETLRRIEEALG